MNFESILDNEMRVSYFFAPRSQKEEESLSLLLKIQRRGVLFLSTGGQDEGMKRVQMQKIAPLLARSSLFGCKK